ncbi:MAG: hypothetical protein U0871_01900 [Gemmataceae bacterium]
MPTATAPPATARALLAALADYGPTVIGGGLTFAAAPPPALVAALKTLHTGVRAVLTGRRWFGIDARGHGTGPGRYGALDPAAPIPPDTVLVTVEGDLTWDRLPPSGRPDRSSGRG